MMESMADSSRDSRPLLIGLTGPIGCGKSNVGRVLAELGGTVIDADALARAASAPGGPALGQIRERFGDAVFDAKGELDRAALAAIVFGDAAALADLEQPALDPSEIELVGAYGARVLGLALNDEGMAAAALEAEAQRLAGRLDLPVSRPLVDGCRPLVPALEAFARRSRATPGAAR